MNLETGAEDTLNSEISTRWFHHPSMTADSTILFAGAYFGTRAINLATGELGPSLAMNDDYLMADRRGRLVAHSRMFTDGDTNEFRISPDGRYIAMQIYEGGIVRFEIASRTFVRLVDQSTRAWPGHFSFGGRWLYYHTRVEDGGWNIFRTDVEGTNAPETVVAGEGLAGIQPWISADGALLIFVRSAEETGWDIWAKNLSSGEEYPLVVSQYRQASPTVSPDGRFLAFESRDARDQTSVVVQDLLTGEGFPVAERVLNPRWDWEGRFLYFESRLVSEIYRVPFMFEGRMIFGPRETMYSDPRSDHTHWDILPEDDTILVGQHEGMAKGGDTWRVILNWSQTLDE